MSGQFSGQVPDQAGNQLPGMMQQRGNLFHSQVPNFSGQNVLSVTDAEVHKMRRFMRDKIYETRMQGQPQPNEAFAKRCQDITICLEETLFKTATTKEEYLNMYTLESRLQTLVRRRPAPTNTPSQQSQFVNATVPDATMTAGTGGSMLHSTPSTGTVMPTVHGMFNSMRGASFRSDDGSLSNGYQQSASSFSMNSGGNNMTVGQRPMSQMMPTPGFGSSNSNQPLINVENTNNSSMFSSVDSSTVSQQMPQRQAGGQNNRMFQHLGGGMRSLLQQRSQMLL